MEFSITRDVEADTVEEAIEEARDKILEWNWYYVHDYMDFVSATIIKDIEPH